jgi:MFS family permease
MMAIFMAAVEATIVATAMPPIVGQLGAFHLFSWVFAAYLLAQAVSTPVYGRLADLYGRKRMFVSGSARRRDELGADTIARLGSAIANALHEVSIVSGVLAVATLVIVLLLPAGLSYSPQAPDQSGTKAGK